MATFVPTAAVKLVLTHTWGGAIQVINTIHVAPLIESRVETSADLLALANGFFNTWKATVMPGCSNQLSLRQVEAFDMSTATAPSAISNIAPASGGGAISPLPPCVAGVVKLSCADLGGRSPSGHLYIGGQVIANDDGGGHVKPTYIATWPPFLSTWNIALAAAVPNYQVVYVRTVRDHAPLPTGEIHAVTGLAMSNVWTTQDRRKG